MTRKALTPEEIAKLLHPTGHLSPEEQFLVKLVELAAKADSGQTIALYFQGTLYEVATQ